MKLHVQLCGRLAARSLAIGRSSVTARKASDNASNARGVAAGKMGRNSTTSFNLIK